MVIMGWSLCKAGLDCYQLNGSITIDQPEMKLVLPLVRTAKAPGMFLSHTNTGKHLEGLVSRNCAHLIPPFRGTGSASTIGFQTIQFFVGVSDKNWKRIRKTPEATLQQQKSRANPIKFNYLLFIYHQEEFDWKRVYLCIFRIHLLNTIPTCALAPHWKPDAVTPIPGRLQTPIFGAISLNPGRRFGNNVSWKQFRPRNPPWVGRSHRQF